jgi:cytochrome c oxidase cbb3-type subunit 3
VPRDIGEKHDRWKACGVGHGAIAPVIAPVIALGALAVLSACERETRRFRETPPSATANVAVAMTELQPGVATPQVDVRGPYEENAYAISEGQTLYNAMNCSGCHFQGGGGIGPPLMDDEWIYGSEPENIFATIVEGRPNGMPSFRGRLQNYQVWRIVAYVRSMSGLTRKEVRPGRQDHMQVTEQPQTTTPSKPTQSTQPPSTIRP